MGLEIEEEMHEGRWGQSNLEEQREMLVGT